MVLVWRFRAPGGEELDEKEKKGLFAHLKNLGFTNRLALYIMVFLAAGLAGGFYLAIRSISGDYTGSLLCWTVVFTPIGTACSVVLSRIVDKVGRKYKCKWGRYRLCGGESAEFRERRNQCGQPSDLMAVLFGEEG